MLQSSDFLAPEIIIIEDDADSRYFLEKAVELLGYRSVSAESCSEALKLLKEGGSPSVILLDLSLPEMNGGEFMKELRGIQHCDGTSVILVSGWDDLAFRAKEIGASGYVRKPVDLKTLDRELKKILELAHNSAHSIS
jgi:CheY-like chemotaxis protein